MDGDIYTMKNSRKSKRDSATNVLREDVLSFILDVIPDIVLVIDNKKNVLFANKTAKEKLGIKTNKRLPKCYKLIHNRNRPPVYCPHSIVLKDRAGHTVENFEPTLGGTFVESIFPILKKQGAISACVHLIRDISHYRYKEKLLLEQDKALETLLDFLEQYVVVFNEQGRIVRANSALLRQLGYNLDEITTKTLIEIYPPENRADITAILPDIKKGLYRIFQIPLFSKDGKRIKVKTRFIRSRWGGENVWLAMSDDLSAEEGVRNKLVSSEMKFARAFYNNPYQMAISERETGRFVDVNNAFLKVLGFSRDEVIGKNAYELGILNEETMRQIARMLQASESVRGLEVRYFTKNKEERYGLFSIDTISTVNEELVISVMEDVTEHKKAEEALRKLETRYQAIVDGQSELICRLDARYNVVFANAAFCRYFGNFEEELAGRCFLDFLAPQDRERVCQHFVLMKETASDVDFDVLVPNVAGGMAWQHWIGRKIQGGRDGTEEYQLVGRDVSEQKTIELALREGQQKFRGVFDSAFELMFVLKPDGMIIEANRAALELERASETETCGKMLWQLRIWQASPTTSARIENAVKDAQKGEAVRFETECMAEEGNIRTVDFSLNPIRDDVGTVILLIAEARDVTEIKQMEYKTKEMQRLMQTEKLTTLGILAAGVAHEINNPTHTIMVNNAIIQEAIANALPVLERYYKEHGDFMLGGLPFSQAKNEIPALLVHIKKCAEHIKDIVMELRDYARESPTELDELVDINAVVTAALTLMGNTIKKATKNFSLTMAENLPPVRGNFRKLEQVVINLIQNACQALTSVEQSVSVDIRWLQHLNQVELTVSDEGVGISEKDLPHITDPFFTTKRPGEGVGLGLAISSTIVREHGGIMSFESKLGKGTTARVRLPICQEK